MEKKTKESLHKMLSKATKMLLKPPPVCKLLLLLNQVGNTLSGMGQRPTNAIHVSLLCLSKALVSDALLRHSEIEVRVGVAYLLTEIARITAPDYPFDERHVKDVFGLLVSAFDNLNDSNSKLYRRKEVILETVARVRFCILMLDFECGDLIKEMLQTFLRTIRDYHPDTVFTAMMTIMTQILEESEPVSNELITDFLSSMEKDNEHISPIARRLAEKIFQNCAVKLKDCVKQAINSLNMSLDNYSEIVTFVCEGSIGQHDDNPSAEKLQGKDAEGTSNKLPKSTMSKGIKGTSSMEISVKNVSGKDQSVMDKSIKNEMLEIVSEDLSVKQSTLPLHACDSRGLTEPSESSLLTGIKEVNVLPDNLGDHHDKHSHSLGCNIFPEECNHVEVTGDTQKSVTAAASQSDVVAHDETLTKRDCPQNRESVVEEQVPFECNHGPRKRKVSENEEDGKNLVGSEDRQLHECDTNSFDDQVRKKRKPLSCEELLASSQQDKSTTLEIHQESPTLIPEEQNGNMSPSLLNPNKKINTERVEVTLERLQSFSIARSSKFLSPTNSEDIRNSPSPMLLAKGIWKDFMRYPLKVFGNQENEMTTMEAISVLVENLSLFGDKEAKLLVELQGILSSILRERENKTHLQKNSSQLLSELEEYGNIANNLRDSVGTLKMEYDDMETHEQELQMQELELRSRMQEIQAKIETISAKRRITGLQMEKESLKAEEIMSVVEEKEARTRINEEKEAETDSAMDNLLSRFFAVRSQYHRATFH